MSWNMTNATHPAVDEGVALRLGEVARRLDCSRRFLEKQIKRGRLHCVRLSARCVRVRKKTLLPTSPRTRSEMGTDAMPRKLSSETLTLAAQELAAIGLSN